MNAVVIAELVHNACGVFLFMTNPARTPAVWAALPETDKQEIISEVEWAIANGNPNPANADARSVILHQVIAGFQLGEDQQRRNRELIGEPGEVV